MEFVALLRGINVGGNKRVEMNRLKELFETLGYANVTTYINSGNVIFESDKEKESIYKNVEKNLKKEFGFDIPVLIKTKQEMRKIAQAVPGNWQNDSAQRTDVAYLFMEIDKEETIDELPVNREHIDIRHTKGAIFWNVERKNYNKSRLNKLIGHESYQFMTLRNVNTARFLAGVDKSHDKVSKR
jgi:uncharacterized protein (DUF1697 family)